MSCSTEATPSDSSTAHSMVLTRGGGHSNRQANARTPATLLCLWQGRRSSQLAGSQGRRPNELIRT